MGLASELDGGSEKKNYIRRTPGCLAPGNWAIH